MISIDTIAQTLTWISVGTYFAAAVSQTWTNFRLKSIEGLSDLFIMLYLNTYIFYICYIFCLDLPGPYKILEPFSFCLVITIVAQRLWYGEPHLNRKMSKILGVNGFLAGLFYFFAMLEPLMMGQVAGWFTFFCDTMCQLPQAAKMHKTKSVKGFSFFYATFIAIANTSELAGAILLKLPIQTVLMGIKAIAIYAFFIYQFLKYRDAINENESNTENNNTIEPPKSNE
jgi:uncharacterized protein with PQ loop repeat